VPLHLAQVDTYAIHIWKYLMMSSSPTAIWPASVPLLVVAGIAGWGVLRAAERERAPIADEGLAMEEHRSPVAEALAWCVWGASVIGPLWLFLSHIQRWSLHGPDQTGIGAWIAGLGHSSIVSFWRFNGEAVWVSVRNGCIVGLGAAML